MSQGRVVENGPAARCCATRSTTTPAGSSPRRPRRISRAHARAPTTSGPARPAASRGEAPRRGGADPAGSTTWPRSSRSAGRRERLTAVDDVSFAVPAPARPPPSWASRCPGKTTSPGWRSGWRRRPPAWCGRRRARGHRQRCPAAGDQPGDAARVPGPLRLAQPDVHRRAHRSTSRCASSASATGRGRRAPRSPSCSTTSRCPTAVGATSPQRAVGRSAAAGRHRPGARAARAAGLDEAVSALDAMVRAQILDPAGDLQRDWGCPCSSSPTTSLSSGGRHDVIVMHEGPVVEWPATVDVSSKSRRPTTPGSCSRRSPVRTCSHF